MHLLTTARKIDSISFNICQYIIALLRDFHEVFCQLPHSDLDNAKVHPPCVNPCSKCINR